MAWEHKLAISTVFQDTHKKTHPPTQIHTLLWKAGKGEQGQVETQSKQKAPEQKAQAAVEDPMRLL